MSKVTKNIEEARGYHEEALDALEEQETRIQALPDDTKDEERNFHNELFKACQDDVTRTRETLERLIALRDARLAAPPPQETPDDGGEGDGGGEGDEGKAIDRRYGRARGELREPPVYVTGGQVSFFLDLYRSYTGDAVARDRLERHQRQMEWERRAMTTAATAGGGFAPPQYLQSYYAELARPGRPFADVLPSSPLPDVGMTINVPRITTGTLMAVQATQNTSLGTQDIVETVLAIPVVTIGGYADLSVQLAERSEPAFDQLLFNDLRADYDRLLDYQLLNGTGTTQHLGIRNVGSINTTSYTAATPTGAGLYPKIFDGIQKIQTARYADPDYIVAHSRRTAWLASTLTTSWPLFQVGALDQTAGTQNIGQSQNITGLPFVSDPNVLTNQGAGTNEDEMYVVRAADMHLWEGALRAEVFRDVGSATGTVRVRLYAFSAFASGRFPASITKISGTGLVTPTF